MWRSVGAVYDRSLFLSGKSAVIDRAYSWIKTASGTEQAVHLSGG